MSPALPVSPLASDSWKSVAFDAVALVYSIAGAVKSARNAHIVSRKLWSLDRQIKEVQAVFYRPATKEMLANVTPEGVRGGIEAVRALNSSFENLHSALRAKGLLNHTKIAAPLSSVMESLADLAEFAEAADLSIDERKRAEVDEIFDRALEELQRGETVEIDCIS